MLIFLLILIFYYLNVAIFSIMTLTSNEKTILKIIISRFISDDSWIFQMDKWVADKIDTSSPKEDENLMTTELDDVIDCVKYSMNRYSFSNSSKYLNTSYNYTLQRPYATFTDVLSSEDINPLLVLSDCIEEYAPDNFEERTDWNQGFGNYAGGNNVTFIGGYIEKIFPELYQHILNIGKLSAEISNGLELGLPFPQDLGVHCVEILKYVDGGELTLHTDTDSYYTMIIVLQDDYDGGNFHIVDPKNDYEHYEFRAPKYGGFIFDSNADHGVTKMTRGERVVLVVEFWPYESVTYKEHRPNPFNRKGIVPNAASTLISTTSFEL